VVEVFTTSESIVANATAKSEPREVSLQQQSLHYLTANISNKRDE
jgi:hypothetical protein